MAKCATAKKGALERGREFLRRQAWDKAYTELTLADREKPLCPDDLAQLAMAAHLTGRLSQFVEIMSRAHQGYLRDGHIPPAIRCAFWTSFISMLNGEMAQAGGWLARAHRLLEECREKCVEEGYLLVPVGFRAVRESDFTTAYEAFDEAVAIGQRHKDADLVSLARQGQGRVLIRQGDVARGLSLLDEAMVAITAGDVSPMIVGGIYCSVIEGCSEVFDLERAQEWTKALDQWCASQPELVPYHGHCQIRRSEILRIHGAWPAASEAAARAREHLSRPKTQPGMGGALYCLAEISRLRGEFAEAEAAYREASELGQSQQPGFALLRLAQGDIEAAVSSISALEQQVKSVAQRTRILEAYVEIMLAAGAIQRSRNAADELSTIAGQLNTKYVHAMATHACGAVLLAEGDAAAALPVLRESLGLWSELAAPYEAARVRVLLTQACRKIGDMEVAEVELAAARRAFQHLGATPDIEKLAKQDTAEAKNADGRLTVREREVLVLIASGKTNRAIANALCISEKTVARHISNIFVKLDLSSRAAATAYVYENNLLR